MCNYNPTEATNPKRDKTMKVNKSLTDQAISLLNEAMEIKNLNENKSEPFAIDGSSVSNLICITKKSKELQVRIKSLIQEFHQEILLA